MKAVLRWTILSMIGWIAAATTFPCVLAAQEDPRWFAGVFYGGDYFTGSSPVWTDWATVRALATRRIEGATLGLEVASTHRFDFGDESVAADVYLDLWPGSYAHLRPRVAPGASLLPLSDWRLELFHALPGGWEVSGNVWLMNHVTQDVEVVGLGVARYLNQWLLRGRGSLSEIAGRRAGAGGVFARRFLGDSRQYFEIGGGFGREVVIVGAGPILDDRDTRFVVGSYQRFLRGGFGIHVSIALNDFEGVPLRRSLSVGLLTRF